MPGHHVGAVHGAREGLTGAGAAVEVDRRLDGVREERSGLGGGARPGAPKVEEAVGGEVSLPRLHLRLVGFEQLGEEPALLAEAVGREVDRLAVDADLREVGPELLTVDVGLHVELVDVPLAVRIARLADRDEIDRLVRTVERDAKCLRALYLQHGRPEPSVGRVVERTRVAHERLALMRGVAGLVLGPGCVGDAEEVLRAHRPPGLNVALRVEHLPLRVHALQDELR